MPNYSASYVTGTTAGITLNAYDVLYVESGGIAIDTTVNSSGEDIILSGGVVSSTTLNSGGFESVVLGGSASSTVVSAGAGQYDHGITSDTIISSGGLETIVQLGAAISSTVSSGGVENVSAGASFTIVDSGGSDIVFAGGTATGTVVNSGGAEALSAGGIASGTTVDSGGVEIVFSGGTASGTTLNSGGTVVVLPGGADPGINLSGGTVISTGVVVISANTFISGFSGTVSGLPLGANVSALVLPGGTLVEALIGAGGTEIVFSGGQAQGSEVAGGGAETVSSGGVASGTDVNGGIETVSAGGTAMSSLIGSGGFEYVSNGAAAFGTVVSGGGTAVLFRFATVTGFVLRDGVEDVTAQTLASGTIVSSGGIINVTTDGGQTLGTIISSGGFEILSAGGASSDTIVSSGGFEIVSGGVVSDLGLSVGGAVDLTFLPFSGVTSALLTSGTGTDTLNVSQGGASYQLQLLGTYNSAVFQAAADSAGGTVVTLVSEAPCFAAGTRIATPAGARAVEVLRAGDIVTLHDGSTAPIVWTGHRRVDCARHPDPRAVLPVRVTAGAFADGVPCRDLFLSPDHAVFTGGVLIPVKHLINGTTIVQEHRGAVWYTQTPKDSGYTAPRVGVAAGAKSKRYTGSEGAWVYFHVELARHDILLAEGLACESFLDTGVRVQFDNGGSVRQLHPDFGHRIWEADGYAPLVVHGAKLEKIRSALRTRAEQSGVMISRREVPRLNRGAIAT